MPNLWSYPKEGVRYICKVPDIICVEEKLDFFLPPLTKGAWLSSLLRLFSNQCLWACRKFCAPTTIFGSWLQLYTIIGIVMDFKMSGVEVQETGVQILVVKVQWQTKVFQLVQPLSPTLETLRVKLMTTLGARSIWKRHGVFIIIFIILYSPVPKNSHEHHILYATLEQFFQCNLLSSIETS